MLHIFLAVFLEILQKAAYTQHIEDFISVLRDPASTAISSK